MAAHPAIGGFCVPKKETGGDMEVADRLLTDTLDTSGGHRRQIWLAPLLESATSIVNMHSIAGAPLVRMLRISEIDLAADLGITMEPGGE